MSWATVICNQQFCQCVEHEQLRQRRFAGERNAARRPDLPDDPLDGIRLIGGSGHDYANFRKTFKEPVRELNVPFGWPFSEWQ